MDEVQSKRQAVLITKRGKPVAKLVPVEQAKDDIFAFSKARLKSTAISFPQLFLRRNGETCIDSAGYACGDLACAGSTANFFKGARCDYQHARRRPGPGRFQHDAPRT